MAMQQQITVIQQKEKVDKSAEIKWQYEQKMIEMERMHQGQIQ
jgi:hypothetical protein